MAEHNYQARDILDKLAIKPGHAVTFVTKSLAIDPQLRQRIVERTGRPPATEAEAVDIVLATIDETDDPVSLLQTWRTRLVPNGGIWLLTARRGLAGYVNQQVLIAAGQQAGVVDNKVCAVSPTMSAMRFVVRKSERARA
jgi:ligand-binding sensor domain-containing protein